MLEKRGTIHSFFAAPASKKAKAATTDDGKEDTAAETEAETTTPTSQEDSAADRVISAQRERADMNKQVAMSKQLHRKAVAVATAASAGGLNPNVDDLLVEETWRGALAREFTKEYWTNLKKFLGREWSAGTKVFPPAGDIFRAFNTCAMARVKVVILGQDPYHDDGQATGYSFSVPRSARKVPSSLQNIYKELSADMGCAKPTHGDLDKWATQGVLLLNASLTVRAHEANSHSKKGWEVFTDAAIRAMSRQRTGLVFLLWGKNAQDKERLIGKDGGHLVLKCAHPSGLSAHRGFFGCKHFSQANAFIVKTGGRPIDWQIQ